MTIEERAKEYAKSLCDGKDNFEDSLIYTIHYDEYVEIAKAQQKIDIEKACLWLQTIILDPKALVQAIISFKDAMEE